MVKSRGKCGVTVVAKITPAMGITTAGIRNGRDSWE